jgi:hypothetical protein
MQLPHVLQGRRLAEPAPKSPPRRHWEQHVTLMQVIVFIFLVYEDVCSKRELSTHLDSLALVSAPLLLRPHDAVCGQG